MARIERLATIEWCEAELAEINVTLDRIMATTTLLLSRRQREISRWNRLSAILDHAGLDERDKEDFLFGPSGTVRVSDADHQDLQETLLCQDVMQFSHPMVPTTMQRLADDVSSSSVMERDLEPTSMDSPLNESSLSAEAVSKLGRVRQQETKVRGILSKMKESLKISTEPSRELDASILKKY